MKNNIIYCIAEDSESTISVTPPEPVYTAFHRVYRIDVTKLHNDYLKSEVLMLLYENRFLHETLRSLSLYYKLFGYFYRRKCQVFSAREHISLLLQQNASMHNLILRMTKHNRKLRGIAIRNGFFSSQ
jgi:hypothetical protein